MESATTTCIKVSHCCYKKHKLDLWVLKNKAFFLLQKVFNTEMWCFWFKTNTHQFHSKLLLSEKKEAAQVIIFKSLRFWSLKISQAEETKTCCNIWPYMGWVVSCCSVYSMDSGFSFAFQSIKNLLPRQDIFSTCPLGFHRHRSSEANLIRSESGCQHLKRVQTNQIVMFLLSRCCLFFYYLIEQLPPFFLLIPGAQYNVSGSIQKQTKLNENAIKFI